jgi:N-acetylglucosamine kinase-like BadF-type ATPase
MEDFYLGIDAGGTKTRCVLGDATKVLASATAGPIKIMRVSEAEAASNLLSLLQEVAARSGVPMDAITCACVGLAGITVPRVEAWTRQALQTHIQGKLLIYGDEEIALDGAFSGAPGVLVIAGTGSNVVGRGMDGTVFHLGGWGPVLSDEGSGYWIGWQAVRAVLRARDRGRETALLAAVLQQWQTTSLAGLVDLGNRVPGPDFSQLAPVVAQCADAGDMVAIEVLESAGRELGGMAAFALQKVQASLDVARTKGNKTPLRLAFTGGVLSHVPQVRGALVATVHSTIPQVEVLPGPVDATLGALWRARHAEKFVTC